MHYGPQFVPPCVWLSASESAIPILPYVLQICPAAYTYLPDSLKNNINVVRHLLLHHGHMWPIVPEKLRINSGFMLMAVQSAPQILGAYVQDHLVCRPRLREHPIVDRIASLEDKDWNPMIASARENLKRARWAEEAADMPSDSPASSSGTPIINERFRAR